jgi:hypothetical protein
MDVDPLEVSGDKLFEAYSRVDTIHKTRKQDSPSRWSDNGGSPTKTTVVSASGVTRNRKKGVERSEVVPPSFNFKQTPERTVPKEVVEAFTFLFQGKQSGSFYQIAIAESYERFLRSRRSISTQVLAGESPLVEILSLTCSHWVSGDIISTYAAPICESIVHQLTVLLSRSKNPRVLNFEVV